MSRCAPPLLILRDGAAQDDDFRAIQRASYDGGETVAVVSDYGLLHNFYPQSVQLAGEVERIGVDFIFRQHLRADGYNFGIHQGIGLPAMFTSTR